jgi:sec-independent protein translocase protein TatC
MSLVEHLTELRRRLFIAVIAIALGGVVAFALYGHILEFLKQPYCDIVPKGQSCRLYVQDPLEAFATRLKIAGYGGLFIASPVVLWQLWRFITPGLHKREKRFAIPFIVASILLFALGAVLAYVTFPKALGFLQSVGGPGFQQIYSPSKYLRFVILVIVAFGISFEFPVVLVFLQLARVLSTARLRKWRRGTAVGITVFAAVITPSQDPWTMLAMAVPMYIFYEISIIIGRIAKR